MSVTNYIPGYSQSQISGLGGVPTNATKAMQTATKALGTNTDPALTDWYEQAYAYYNAVQSGQEAKPDEAAWSDFLNQMDWAAQTLGYNSSTWGDDIGGSSFGDDSDSTSNPFNTPPDSAPAQESVPAGASIGTMDNVVWNSPDACITVPGMAGDTRTQDIWSNNISLDMPSLSAHLTCEVTQDTRLSPPEDVLKIIATDAATGAQTVYYVHDYQDATISIHSPTQAQISDSSGLTTWAAYADPSSEEATDPESNLTGELQADGTYLYDGTGGQVIEFSPIGSGVDGEVTTNDVQGDVNISVKNTDDVTVQQVSGQDYDYLVTVKHTDGSSDVYQLHSEYKSNINGVPEHMKFVKSTGEACNQQAEATDKGDQTILPNDFVEDFTINGLESVKESDAEDASSNVDYPKEIQNLAEVMGLDPEELMKQLQGSKNFSDLMDQYDGKDNEFSSDELSKLASDGAFPPMFGGEDFNKLTDFLYNHDHKLQSAMESCKTSNNTAFKIAMKQVTARLCELLGTMYPGIKANHPNSDKWWEANDLSYQGQNFELVSDGFASMDTSDLEASDYALGDFESMWEDAHVDADNRGKTELNFTE